MINTYKDCSFYVSPHGTSLSVVNVILSTDDVGRHCRWTKWWPTSLADNNESCGAALITNTLNMLKTHTSGPKHNTEESI